VLELERKRKLVNREKKKSKDAVITIGSVQVETIHPTPQHTPQGRVILGKEKVEGLKKKK
jgi:hypothetical protein